MKKYFMEPFDLRKPFPKDPIPVPTNKNNNDKNKNNLLETDKNNNNVRRSITSLYR